MEHARRSRAAYSGSADLYLRAVGSTLSDEIETTADLALLDRFVQESRAHGGCALDAGCGPGRVARRLADHGYDTIGLDIADHMVEIAAREHPDLAFALGRLDRLPFAGDRFGVVVAWYSIITTPPGELTNVFREFHRVLIEAGSVLVAFQSGRGERAERPSAYGTNVDLTLFRHDVEVVAGALRESGFTIDAAVERGPQRSEQTPQAFVTAMAERPPRP